MPDSEFETETNDNGIAWLPHLLGLIFGFLGPLVMYFISKKDNEFITEQSRKALNWQLSLLIYSIICIPLSLIIIGYIALIALFILNIVYSIKAMFSASKGQECYYKFSLNLIK